MRVRIAHLSIPLRRPFVTSAGVVEQRDVVLVGLSDDGVTGWGEAAPWPAESIETVEQVWVGLTSGEPGPHASAACDEARWDRRARLAERPLWRHLGGQLPAVVPSLAIGMVSDVAAAAADAHEAGFRVVKLKIEPRDDVERVRTAMDAAPDLIVAVDANGSYAPGMEELLLELDALGPGYVEQPYPRGSHEAHQRLRYLLTAPLVLDEDVRTVADAEGVIAAGAADVLVVKPAALGISGALRVRELALEAGLAVKPSGFLESGIGRAHTAALASLSGSVWADLAPAEAYFTVDPVRQEPGGGIGLTLDDEPASRFLVREAEFEV